MGGCGLGNISYRGALFTHASPGHRTGVGIPVSLSTSGLHATDRTVDASFQSAPARLQHYRYISASVLRLRRVESTRGTRG